MKKPKRPPFTPKIRDGLKELMSGYIDMDSVFAHLQGKQLEKVLDSIQWLEDQVEYGDEMADFRRYRADGGALS